MFWWFWEGFEWFWGPVGFNRSYLDVVGEAPALLAECARIFNTWFFGRPEIVDFDFA